MWKQSFEKLLQYHRMLVKVIYEFNNEFMKTFLFHDILIKSSYPHIFEIVSLTLLFNNHTQSIQGLGIRDEK